MAQGPSAPEAGSVMEQMLKLFEPPGGYPQDRDAELHPYFKRPGRGHNHDTCDSCREGGALICCDSCPSSFHLQCHDPPLEDEDIPEGDWICIRCFASKPEAQRVRRVIPELGKPLLKKIIDKEEQAAGSNTDKPVAVDGEWRPKKKREEDNEDSRPKRATRLLKLTKYNDNSTEEEYSESDFIDVEIPTSLLIKKRTYIDIYRDHLERKPRSTSSWFQSLLEVANQQNAEEFHLPKNIYVEEKFPYAWKWSTAERRHRNQVSEEGDSRGNLKLCYVCVRSSRVGPLVQCDFCPCLFHMDCLDPPLSEVPSDVWMCPNHVECLLDSRLSSSRLTERVRLWDRFANQSIDTHAVKIQFMKKCSRRKAQSRRVCRTVAALKTVQVPAYIKLQYNRPPSLLPGPGYDRWVDPSVLRKRRLTEGGGVVSKREQMARRLSGNETTCEEEMQEEEVMEEGEKGEVMEEGETGEKMEKNSKRKLNKESPEDLESMVSLDIPRAQQGSQETISSTDNKSANDDSMDESGPTPPKLVKSEAPAISELPDLRLRSDGVSSGDKDPGSGVASGYYGSVDAIPSPSQSIPAAEEVTKLIEHTQKREMFGQSAIVQKPAAPIKPIGPDTSAPPKMDLLESYSQEELEWVSSLVSLQTALLRRKLGQTGEDSLQCRELLPSMDRFEDQPCERSPDSSTVSGISFSGKVASEQQLMEQLQEYLITHTEVENLDPIVLKYLAARQIQTILPSRLSLLRSNVKARASLTPVGSRKQPYYMQYRTLDIGTGPDIHLNLRDFGHCNMLSDRHATLFYDELSGHYEVLNYSRHGTTVDECLYSLDVRAVADRYKNVKDEGDATVPVMAGPKSASNPCYCASPDEPVQDGFEGSALLHHGSRIKFGCLEFVFSVATVLSR